ncbi:MAG: M48 family metallopeptidase [Chloroflexi bacterium]|nr:M48 family metallopeptidase [Chloroflexota bacterium]
MPKRSKPIVIGKQQADLDGRPVVYTLKLSSRARNARLEISARNGLTVIVPKGYGSAEAQGLVLEKRRWILNKLDQYTGVLETACNAADRRSFYYLGRRLEIVAEDGTFGRGTVRVDGDKLVVPAAPSGNGGASALLEKWGRAQAAGLIKNKVDGWCPRLGLQYKRLIVRAQRTRWASCSAQGTLSFNWRLIMAPEPVIDYVVVHELVHLKRMDHSRRFWQALAEHCPDWKKQRQWLREHQMELLQ